MKKKCNYGLEVQSLIFDKNYFNENKARDWANIHGYKNHDIDIKDKTIRIRQSNPENFNKDIFRTIKFRKGIQAVVACPIYEAGGSLDKSYLDGYDFKNYEDLIQSIKIAYTQKIDISQEVQDENSFVDIVKKYISKIEELRDEYEEGSRTTDYTVIPVAELSYLDYDLDDILNKLKDEYKLNDSQVNILKKEYNEKRIYNIMNRSLEYYYDDMFDNSLEDFVELGLYEPLSKRSDRRKVWTENGLILLENDLGLEELQTELEVFLDYFDEDNNYTEDFVSDSYKSFYGLVNQNYQRLITIFSEIDYYEYALKVLEDLLEEWRDSYEKSAFNSDLESNIDTTINEYNETGWIENNDDEDDDDDTFDSYNYKKGGMINDKNEYGGQISEVLSITRFSEGLKESIKKDFEKSGFSDITDLFADTPEKLPLKQKIWATAKKIQESVEGFNNGKNTYLQAYEIAEAMYKLGDKKENPKVIVPLITEKVIEEKKVDDVYEYEIESVKGIQSNPKKEVILWGGNVFLNKSNLDNIPIVFIPYNYDSKEEAEERAKKIIEELKSDSFKGFNILSERHLNRINDFFRSLPVPESTKELELKKIIMDIPNYGALENIEKRAIADIVSTGNYKLELEQAMFLFLNFKNSNLKKELENPYNNQERFDEIYKEIWLKNGTLNKYGKEVEFYIEEIDMWYTLGETGLKFIDSVKARIETLKGVKYGYDLFPEIDTLSSEFKKTEEDYAKSRKMTKELLKAVIRQRDEVRKEELKEKMKKYVEQSKLQEKYRYELGGQTELSNNIKEKYIAKKYNVTLQEISERVKKGMKVEAEHSDNLEIQRKIALDHINEILDYYDRLEIMEKQSKAKDNIVIGKKISPAQITSIINYLSSKGISKDSYDIHTMGKIILYDDLSELELKNIKNYLRNNIY